jgi:hypothetical protein
MFGMGHVKPCRMDQMLTLPADRPRPHPMRLVLLMAMTVLLYMVTYGVPNQSRHQMVTETLHAEG